MTNAWTPGPWKYLDIGTIETDDGTIIAECVEEQNGDLIAAAPDMAEALEEAILVLSALSPEDESLYGPRALMLARAALAKARGAP